MYNTDSYLWVFRHLILPVKKKVVLQNLQKYLKPNLWSYVTLILTGDPQTLLRTTVKQ